MSQPWYIRLAWEQALEALEGIDPGNMTPMAEESWKKAREALRQALAEQASKAKEQAKTDAYIKQLDEALAEQPAQPEQEPVRREQKMFMDEQEFYTTPPQRTWVGLTDEEINEIAKQGHQRWVEFGRAIEAALKEKNT